MCKPADHEKRKRPSQWPNMPTVGTWDLEGKVLEMKNCPDCHSTLCKEKPGANRIP